MFKRSRPLPLATGVALAKFRSGNYLWRGLLNQTIAAPNSLQIAVLHYSRVEGVEAPRGVARAIRHMFDGCSNELIICISDLQLRLRRKSAAPFLSSAVLRSEGDRKHNHEGLGLRISLPSGLQLRHGCTRRSLHSRVIYRETRGKLMSPGKLNKLPTDRPSPHQ